ncbi:EAL domain-containing protein [Acetobacter orientalis]|uniref:EAL domain-containing protein n=1 Tax=Acetobacter orientalis TaxID=146474 RepID=UPI000A3D360B|nr:EAL domain-containing protein [Acetobacter orientalis]
MQEVKYLDPVQRLYCALLNTADAVLLAATDTEMCDKTCADLVRDALFQAVWIGRKESKGSRLTVIASAGPGTDGLADFECGYTQPTPCLPVAVRAWECQQLVYSNDELEDQKQAPWFDFLERNQWRAVLSVPVWRSGVCWAVISFVFAQTDMFDEQSIGLCRRVANLLGHSLDKFDSQKRLQLRQAEEAWLARHDPLTALPNRLALDEYLPQALARAKQNGTTLALGMLDLDDFKSVNDGFGHKAGDCLLKEFSQRLKKSLRQADYVARLGGDEFVVVLENLDSLLSVSQVMQILDSLHVAVETPFKFGEHASAMVGMTLGLALCPVDGEELDTLLRRADAAMYQSKQNKSNRKNWWSLASSCMPLQIEEAFQQASFEAYGLEAQDLLTRAKTFLLRIRQNFIDSFYEKLAKIDEAREILATLSDDEKEHLKKKQADHLDFLLDPKTKQSDILQRASKLGVIHALCGISPSLLSESYSIYRRLLIDSLDKALLRAYDRYHILLTTEVRLQDDKGAQLKSAQIIEQNYFSVLFDRVPITGRIWPDISKNGMDALARLPGIRAVLLFRMNPAGELIVEHSAGSKGAALADAIHKNIGQPTLTAKSPFQNSVTGLAWRTRRQHSCASYITDPRGARWRNMMEPLGIRSSLSIPISSEKEQLAVVLTVLGAYPNQFETQRMKQFARSLQYRWEQLWVRCSSQQGIAVTEEKSCYLRDRLFNGGLRMYVQPIVNLRTGELLKVEALARIEDVDGRIIEPSGFLSLLGQSELDRLFQMGLEEGLSSVKKWEAQGYFIKLAINMPPTYLINKEGPDWVGSVLKRYAVPAENLTVELLEAPGIEAKLQDKAIQRYKELGVKIAIDDLGAGYSNFSRLSSIAFNIIKIDRCILRNIYISPLQTFSMVKSVLDMGHGFHEQIIVEGLENDEIIEAVSHLGAQCGQGFGIARPLAPENFLEWKERYSASVKNKTNGKRLVSDLGALAYHWMSTRGGQTLSKYSYHSCLMTEWLNAQGLADTEVAEWHKECHYGPDPIAASYKFTTWLVKRITGV